MIKQKRHQSATDASAAMGAGISGATAGRETASAAMAMKTVKNAVERVMRTMTIMTTNSRQPVACACGWTGHRIPGKPVQCPKCGAFAAFQ